LFHLNCMGIVHTSSSYAIFLLSSLLWCLSFVLFFAKILSWGLLLVTVAWSKQLKISWYHS
jgi:hypothetical protein